MTNHNDIKGEMKSVEINQNNNKIKKAWVVPELEVLNGRKTYGGTLEGESENYWLEPGDVS